MPVDGPCTAIVEADDLQTAPIVDDVVVSADSAELVEDGMCLALERRAAVDGLGGAQFEDNVLVGADGPELLTHVP